MVPRIDASIPGANSASRQLSGAVVGGCARPRRISVNRHPFLSFPQQRMQQTGDFYLALRQYVRW